MKGQRFRRRLGFAIAGIACVWRTKTSFRTQVRVAAVSVALLAVGRFELVWTALILLASGLVLALEAVNAALEYLADALHPEVHPLIGAAKDAAAGAVLIAGVTALGVAVTAGCNLLSSLQCK